MKGSKDRAGDSPTLSVFFSSLLRSLLVRGVFAPFIIWSVAASGEQYTDGSGKANRLPLVAVGPIADRTMQTVTVLGNEFRISGLSPDYPMIGDYVLVSSVIPSSGMPAEPYELQLLTQQYVPGASYVAELFVGHAGLDETGFVSIQNTVIDVNALISSAESTESCVGERCVFGVIGTQPLPGGPLLADFLLSESDECLLYSGQRSGCRDRFEALIDGFLSPSSESEVDVSIGLIGDENAALLSFSGAIGRKASGSLGTGKANGSLGTGKANGSLGTGKASASPGTGKAVHRSGSEVTTG